jgi:hypothetical protein
MIQQQALPLDHPIGQDFLRRFFRNQRVLSIPRNGDMQPGQCYRNVLKVVAEHGGSPRTGWLLTWWPGRYVEALHHAVWCNPAGDLIDVTGPSFPLMTEKRINFILDGNIAYDEFGPSVPSLFQQIDQSEGVRDFISTTCERVKVAGKMKAMLAELPHEKSGSGIKLLGPRPVELDRLSARHEELLRRQSLYNPRFVAGNFERAP